MFSVLIGEPLLISPAGFLPPGSNEAPPARCRYWCPPKTVFTGTALGISSVGGGGSSAAGSGFGISRPQADRMNAKARN